MSSLAGLRALVTGGAKRLGREMALFLGGQGFDVAVHYNGSKAEADEVVALLNAMGRKAVACATNLLDEDETAALGPTAVEALGGPISVLINNASIFEPDEIETATRESWDRAIGSNLRAPFVLTQFLSGQAPEPSTDANGEPLAEALIINLIDQRVRKLTPDFVSYTVAKMGLWAFTQTSAQALAGRLPARAHHQFSPLEGSGPQRRFLHHWRPDLCVLVHSDLWPLLLDGCADAGIPVALLDAHLPDASAQGWKRFPATAGYVVRGIRMALCRDMASRNHLRDMGLEMAQVGALATDMDPQTAGKTGKPLATRLFELAATHATDVMC